MQQCRTMCCSLHLQGGPSYSIGHGLHDLLEQSDLQYAPVPVHGPQNVSLLGDSLSRPLCVGTMP